MDLRISVLADRGHAVYVEPNVWARHKIAASITAGRQQAAMEGAVNQAQP